MTDPGAGYSVEIGYDPVLSSKEGSYVVCAEVGDRLVQDRVTGTISYCTDV